MRIAGSLPGAVVAFATGAAWAAVPRCRCVAVAVLLVGCASSPREAGNDGEILEPKVHAVEHREQWDAGSQQCLALAIYWEARGEGRDGMLAVGSVVLNRVEDPRFPDSVCNVVYQGGETPPCQFSWWCDGKSDRPSEAALWSASLELAAELMINRYQDPTGGALFFHNSSIESPWRRTRTTAIGSHVFYR